MPGGAQPQQLHLSLTAGNSAVLSACWKAVQPAHGNVVLSAQGNSVLPAPMTVLKTVRETFKATSASRIFAAGVPGFTAYVSHNSVTAAEPNFLSDSSHLLSITLPLLLLPGLSSI